MPLTRRARLTQRDTGDFKIICNGAAVCPGGWSASLMSWFLILVPSGVQIGCINSQFSKTILVNVFYAFTMSLSLGALLMTTLTDPGAIPRASKEMRYSAKELGITEGTKQVTEVLLSNNRSVDEEAGLVKRRLSEYEHYAIVKGAEVNVFVCRTCGIVKPPRSFHCSICKTCIEVHDHHCPWVGTCVGKRNHKYFLMFAFFTTLHALLTILLDILFLSKKLYN